MFRFFCLVRFFVIPANVSDDFIKWFTYIFPMYRMFDYLIGCLLGDLWVYKRTIEEQENNRIRTELLEVLSIILVIIVNLIYTYEVSIPLGSWFVRTCLYLPVSMILVWTFATGKGFITQNTYIMPFLVSN